MNCQICQGGTESNNISEFILLKKTNKRGREKTITLTRDNLESGVYFFGLTKDNKVIKSQKIIIPTETNGRKEPGEKNNYLNDWLLSYYE